MLQGHSNNCVSMEIYFLQLVNIVIFVAHRVTMKMSNGNLLPLAPGPAPCTAHAGSEQWEARNLQLTCPGLEWVAELENIK